VADLLKESEATPDTYPALPTGLSTLAAAVDAGMIWERIEAYTRTRYTAREIVWTVDGCGGERWTPPLAPVASFSAELWDNGAWEAVALPDGPVGYILPSDGTYRVTGQVGAGDPPKAVTEAYRRLAEYMADDDDRAGVSSYSVNMGGAIAESYSRSASHAARALQNSGAADLLRPYRRQK
jgi:hypothetical protein